MNNKSKNNNLNLVFNLLKYTFVIVPIVAGFDKYLNFLTDWQQYMEGPLLSLLPFSTQTFMMIVGFIEIVAGILVWKNSKIGGYVVAAWLTGIALSLLIGFNYVDVAVRDLVMAIAAFSMAKLSEIKK